MSDTVKITRKYALIPTFSEYKEWIKRIMAFMQSFYTNKIKYYEGRLEKETDATNIEKINSRLNTLHGQLKEFEESGEITQKNINDYTYDLIRRAMESGQVTEKSKQEAKEYYGIVEKCEQTEAA